MNYLHRLILRSSAEILRYLCMCIHASLIHAHDHFRNRDKNRIKHECLRQDELPIPKTLVAIDAEFVSMQQVGLHFSSFASRAHQCLQEETEYRSDGSKTVLRPARMSLARVSVLRGDGSAQGIPFIDDHIYTSETIVDYLTEFSGIKCMLQTPKMISTNLLQMVTWICTFHLTPLHL